MSEPGARVECGVPVVTGAAFTYLLPLFGVTERAVRHRGDTDNVTPLVTKENRGELEQGLYPPDPVIPGPP